MREVVLCTCCVNADYVGVDECECSTVSCIGDLVTMYWHWDTSGVGLDGLHGLG